MRQEMQVEWVSIDLIKPYPKNPRNNDASVPATAESIKQFGWKQPIVVDKDGVIIAGHTRYKAARKLELDTVPVVYARDLTDEQVRAYRLADNKTGELSLWDDELLGIELSSIPSIDMTLFGFEITLPDGEPQEDNYEAEPPEEPISRVGDMYELGRHRLLCGDATSIQDVRKLTHAGDHIDLLLTDPPYNVEIVGGNHSLTPEERERAGGKKILNDKMDDAEFLDFLTRAFNTATEVMRPGAAYYIFHPDSEGEAFRRAARETLGKVRQCLVWNKNTIVMGRQDYQWKHEPILYGWKDGDAHYFIDDRTQATVYEDKGVDIKKLKKAEAIELLEKILGDKTSTTVINEDRPARSAEHPTMKPIKLLGRLIKNSTKPGDKILDLFGGSGSTLIAAEQLGRTCYMMELDPRYCDVIIDRWETLTGKKAVKIQ